MGRYKKNNPHIIKTSSKRKKNTGTNLKLWRQKNLENATAVYSPEEVQNLSSSSSPKLVNEDFCVPSTKSTSKETLCQIHFEDSNELEWRTSEIEEYDSNIISSVEQTPKPITGRRIIDIIHFIEQIKKIDSHNGVLDCSLKDMQMVSETREGLISYICLKCYVCGIQEWISSEDEGNSMNINEAAVSGIMSTGGGHSQLVEILNVMELPLMTIERYVSCKTIRGTTTETPDIDSMGLAEASILPRELESVDVSGLPLFPIAADGGWANRVYKSNYSSLSAIETLVALKELSTFLNENTIQSRRNLRSKIEKRSLEINEEFLSAFREVKESFDAIYNDVNEMNSAIQNISTELSEGMANTHALIEQTSKLQAEKQKLMMDLDITKSFLKRFQLAPNELATLRETTVTDDFFGVLERVQTIHSDCRLLMQAGYQTAALDIMDQMSMYQEAAMERLYRWAQSHCKNIESLATGELLAKALSKLQSRPVLFKYVVSEYCTQRRAVLVRLFLDALTKGGPSGHPPPIENRSHDPHRYVGDMLAYLRRTIPNEANLLNTLLKNCNQSEIGDLVETSLSEITEGVCTPLSVRIDQITSFGSIPVKSLYTISGLISSYLRIFSQEVGKESGLVNCLQGLGQSTSQILVTSLSQVVKREVVSVSAPPAPNLAPSPALSTLTSLLEDILSAPTDSNQANLNKIVGCVVDPVLQSVNVSASRLSTADMAVYLLNCLHLIQNTLALYQFLDDRIERLQAQCDAQLDTLTSEQASSLVANLNLGPIYTILQEQGKSPLSQIPGMHPSNLQNFAGKLENYLSFPEVLVLSQVNCLVSASHRSFVQQRSTEVILAIYRELYQAIYDPSNLYENPNEILPRSPEQLKEILLSMDN